MIATLRSIRWTSVGIAIFAFYLVPWLLLITLTSVLSYTDGSARHPVEAWMILIPFYAIVLAPLSAAYTAAKLATRIPLMHGLLVGVFGASVTVLPVIGPSFELKLGIGAIPLASALVGAWLWRYRSSGASLSR